MVTRIVFLLATVVLTLISATSAHAEAGTFTDNVRVPINITVFSPCASGGAGEVVELSGTLHMLFHVTVDDSGGFHAKGHFQPHVSGVGLTTGDKYQGTEVRQGLNIQGTVGFELTFIRNFRIIGQGPGNNFLLHETFHVTVKNGEVTAFVDNASIECR